MNYQCILIADGPLLARSAARDPAARMQDHATARGITDPLCAGSRGSVAGSHWPIAARAVLSGTVGQAHSLPGGCPGEPRIVSDDRRRGARQCPCGVPRRESSCR